MVVRRVEWTSEPDEFDALGISPESHDEVLAYCHSRGLAQGQFMVLLDIDNFARLNRDLGRAASDTFLLNFWREDYCGLNVGGIRHAVVWECFLDRGVGAYGALELVLRTLITALFASGQGVLSLSVGCVWIPESADQKEVKAALQKADEALLRAKKAGGNMYGFEDAGFRRSIEAPHPGRSTTRWTDQAESRNPPVSGQRQIARRLSRFPRGDGRSASETGCDGRIPRRRQNDGASPTREEANR